MSLGTYLTVDESRVPSHHYETGELTYNKSKPDIWAAESITLHDRDTRVLIDFCLPKEFSNPAAILWLVDRIPKGSQRHHIIADAGFDSFGLACALNNQNLYFTLNCKGNTSPTELWDGLGVDFLRDPLVGL
jgi:hypothetical protein